MLKVKLVKIDDVRKSICVVCGYEFFEAGVSLVIEQYERKKRKKIGVVCPDCLKAAEIHKDSLKEKNLDFSRTLDFCKLDLENEIDEKTELLKYPLGRIEEVNDDIEFLHHQYEKVCEIEKKAADIPINCPTLNQYNEVKKDLGALKLLKDFKNMVEQEIKNMVEQQNKK